jgi:hypothetical protein
MKAKCKKPYPTYAAALKAMFELLERPELGSVYPCERCEGAYHIGSRRFTLIKPRGRGGARRRLVRFGSASSGKSSRRSLAGSSAMRCGTGSRTHPRSLGGFVPRSGEGRGV